MTTAAKHCPRVYDRRELPFYLHLLGEGEPERVDVEIVRSQFSAVRCYHQCRPLDPSAYFGGIKLPCHEYMMKRVYNLYNEEIGHCSMDEIAAVDRELKRREEGICVSLEYEFGLAYASHYLLYGSEYAMCLLIHLPGGESNRPLLTKAGIPTLFEITLPLDFISDEDCLIIADSIRRYRREADNYKVPIADDVCLEIKNGIPGSCITNHWHPSFIWDVFSKTVHQNAFTECQSCSSQVGRAT